MKTVSLQTALWSWQRLSIMERERVERYMKMYASGQVASVTAYEVIAKITTEVNNGDTGTVRSA